MGELWTAARAARELGFATQTAQALAQKHLGDGVNRVGYYLVADDDWWRSHLVRRHTAIAPEVRERIRSLAVYGVSAQEIAWRTGVSETTVRRYAKGLFPTQASRQDRRERAVRFQSVLDTPDLGLSATDRQVARRLAEGATLRQIGQELRLSGARVQQIAAKIWRKKRIHDYRQSDAYRKQLARENEERLARIAEESQLQELASQIGARAANALWRAGYRTREQIAALDDAKMLRLRNFGVKSLQSVRRWLCDDQAPSGR